MKSNLLKGTVIGSVVVVALLALLAALLPTKDIGSGKIVMGIPGIQYEELARTYRRDLEHFGVELETRQSTEGSRPSAP